MFKAMIASLMLSGLVSAAGLKIGDQIESHSLTGNIRVSCQDSRDSRTVYVRCSDSYLLPSIRSKFVADADADKVVLSYKDRKGKNKRKSSKFKNGESTRSFNLWIWSLTQRPMLKNGENIINYKLTKKGEDVDNGEFIVNVEPQPIRSCPYDSFFSSNMNDCVDAGYVCARYFQRHNYCR